jgi:hypothetical protein
LAACGGGGGGGAAAGTPVLGGASAATGTTPSTLVSLALVADKLTIPNSGAEVVTFTVTALAAGNAALTGVAVPITVAVDGGAIVTPSAKTTSTTTGAMTAEVKLTDKTSRTVKVTVSSGSGTASFTKTASFDVVDSVNGSKVADLALVLDKTSIPNNGSESVKLTVTSLDASRNAIGGSPVSFAVLNDVSNGAVVNTSGKTSTDATSGQLVADISLASNHANRAITVQATSGTVVRTISFDVITVLSVVPKANDLTITLSKPSVFNSGGESVDVVVTAVDASRNAAAGIKVVFAVDSNAVVVVGNSTTDANGQAKANVQIGADRTNRTVTVTASSDALSRQAAFKVAGAKLQATLVPSTLRNGEAGRVEYTLTDANSNPMTAVDITVNGPGSATKTDKTDSSGKYSYSYAAAGAGPTPISAAAGGTRVVSTIQIDASVSDVPATTTIASATFTASSVVVNVNAVGSIENRAELRLLFRSSKNEPIPNVRVRLGLGDNTAGTDADISSGKDNVITSDANGIAVTSLIAGQRASATDQVQVFACFGKDSSVATITACDVANLRTISLTVVEQPVSISIGSNELVIVKQLTYQQEFTVLVVDSAGNPKAEVQLAPVIDLVNYLKGNYLYDAIALRWVKNLTAVCLNEDNSVGVGYRNGTIEVGEDVNGNQQLDPRKSDISISMVGSTKTDANGLAVLRVEYPQNMGSWLEFSIKVSASGVLSPPAWTGRLAFEGDPPLKGAPRYSIVPIAAITAQAAPPFAVSPYGQVNSCVSPN